MMKDRISLIVPKLNGFPERKLLYERDNVNNVPLTVGIGWNSEVTTYAMKGDGQYDFCRVEDGLLKKMMDVNWLYVTGQASGPDGRMVLAGWATPMGGYRSTGGMLLSYVPGRSSVDFLCGSHTDVSGIFVAGRGSSARFQCLESIYGITRDGTIWASDETDDSFRIVKVTPDGLVTSVYEHPSVTDKLIWSMGGVSSNGEVFVGVSEYDMNTFVVTCHLSRLEDGSLVRIADMGGSDTWAGFGNVTVTDSGQVLVATWSWEPTWTYTEETLWSVSFSGEKDRVMTSGPTEYYQYFVSDRMGRIYLYEEVDV